METDGQADGRKEVIALPLLLARSIKK